MRLRYLQTIWAAFFVAVSALLSAPQHAAANEPVCSFFGIERAMFNTWRSIANDAPAAPRLDGFDYQPQSLETPDGETLSGYKVTVEGIPKHDSALLVVPGNATRAESLLGHLLPALATGGHDAFIFDYRGYGQSTGTPLLDTIGRDTNLVAQHLLSQGYDSLSIYGTSMGGIVTLGPNMDLAPIKAVIIDSSPAHFPWYAFCPDAYQPINNVPADASNMLLIASGIERVVDPEAVEKLGNAVEANGGKHVFVAEFHHALVRRADFPGRVKLVLDFLADQ